MTNRRLREAGHLLVACVSSDGLACGGCIQRRVGIARAARGRLLSSWPPKFLFGAALRPTCGSIAFLTAVKPNLEAIEADDGDPLV